MLRLPCDISSDISSIVSIFFMYSFTPMFVLIEQLYQLKWGIHFNYKQDILYVNNNDAKMHTLILQYLPWATGQALGGAEPNCSL